MEMLADVSAAIAEYFDRQVAFLQRLVQTKSANPFTPDTSSSDTPVEQAVAALIQQELMQFGLQAKAYGVSPQRPNVLCTLPGLSRKRKTLILTTHMDTVEPSNDYTRDPWEAHIEDRRLYGLGAADAKAQIAIFIFAAQALRKAGIQLAGNLTLAFVVDEEPGACSPY